MYTFFWIGKGTEDKRESGVGFAIRSKLVDSLPSSPKGINDRLMTLRIPLQGNKYATLISAYAPTMTNPDSAKEKFYAELKEQIEKTPRADKLIILGDFNARVGSDSETWKGVLGNHGVGKNNSNGDLLLETCSAYNLIITNTFFQLPKRQRTTWMHPRSKHWHLIDFVIVRQRDRQDVKVTRAMCGADCWTDHRLLLSKMKLQVKPAKRPQGKKVPKKLDTAKLKESSTKQLLVQNLNENLSGLQLNSGDVEQDWVNFRDQVYSTAKETVGVTKRKHQDWFDENDPHIQALLDEKESRFKVHLSDPTSASKKNAYIQAKSVVQKELRAMQDTWFSNKAKEIQGYADSGNMKMFYASLSAVYGPQASGSSPVLSADGKTLHTEKEQILERWAEHFQSVLNRPSTINDDAIDRLEQLQVNNQMDDPPTESEVKKAISQLSNGKAPGSDAIAAEIYSAGSPEMINKLTVLFSNMWDQEKIPQELKDATILHLYKRKGDRKSCDNHRGISLLPIAGKILARVMLNRLQAHLEDGLLPETQCGFRKGRGTVDMIFAARQVQEKCREQHLDLYTTFVDLTKAFDTVSREGLWRIMAKFGCPARFINMVRQFHDGMQASVQEAGVNSEPFPVTNGVKQGCVLAPTLFSMMFTAMLSDAFREDACGMQFRYRTDCSIFNNTVKLKARTKVMVDIIRDLLFADDCALNAYSESEMQRSMDLFSAACRDFGLTISTKKTEVMFQPAPGQVYKAPKIVVEGEKLKPVHRFPYLGSTLSASVTVDDEVNRRIAQASAAFGALHKNVWTRRGLSTSTKIEVYHAVVIPSLLYSSESWTVYSRHVKQMNSFHMRCLRKLLRIQWFDHIPDTEVLERAESESIYALITRARLRWSGHVARMPDDRLPKRILYGELCSGRRSQGGQKKRYKDLLGETLDNCGIPRKEWDTLAQDRPSWRSLVRSGVASYEDNRIQKTKAQRAKRKAKVQT